ncbi:hypothetical protein K505DRAFT_355698 [Melanomma pulvis-pyrius CBS 109.77]|uniref:Uncharacterized protein n=1 Tax=Melanomma pulvis-pyrius CBS 109.77 TaxID=1314802 RepID=A0A6A6XW60_9PLEO|nr:hypothetical protein K505DRAFT_355698 [Melanomma pulvis-pyrius CBS 109.77]
MAHRDEYHGLHTRSWTFPDPRVKWSTSCEVCGAGNICCAIGQLNHLTLGSFRSHLQCRLEAVLDLINDNTAYLEAFLDLYLSKPDLISIQTRFVTRLSWERALYTFWLQKIEDLFKEDSAFDKRISTMQNLLSFHHEASNSLEDSQESVDRLFVTLGIPPISKFTPRNTSVPTQPLSEILVELSTAKHIVYNTEFWDIVEDLPDEPEKTVGKVFDKLRALTREGMAELKNYISLNGDSAVSTFQPRVIHVCYLCFATGSTNQFPSKYQYRPTEIANVLRNVRKMRAQEEDVKENQLGGTPCSKLKGHAVQAWDSTLDPKPACKTCCRTRPYKELFDNDGTGTYHLYDTCAEWPTSHHCYWLERTVFEVQGLNLGGFEDRETCRNFLIRLRQSRSCASPKGSLQEEDS